ncbi:MAG: hypothetical protein WD066_18640 [Planctomycetaceae bacterium]
MSSTDRYSPDADAPVDSRRDRPRFATGTPARWLFRIAAAFAAAFVLTVMLLSAAAFSDTRPAGIAVVERHAGPLIALGVGGTLLFGLAAMTVDRLAMTRAARGAGGPPVPPQNQAEKNVDPTDGPADESAA